MSGSHSGSRVSPAVQAGGKAWLSPYVLTAGFLAPALFLVLNNFDRSIAAWAAFDQNEIHLPEIRRLAGEWPWFDFRQGHGAPMIPGYHVFFAAIYRWVTTNVIALKLMNLSITVGLLLTLLSAAARTLPPVLAAALCMPFAASCFVFSAGVWLVTDNTAWWGVVCALLLALRPAVDGRTYVRAALLTLMILMVRQVHIWIVIPLVIAAWLGDSAQLLPQGDAGQRFRRAARMALSFLPALLVLLWFVRLWKGFTSPDAGPLRGLTPAAIPMALGLLGAYGLFFAPIFLPALRRVWNRQALNFLIAGAGLGALAGVATATSYLEPNRTSGIWILARVFPAYLDRSLPIVALAALGGCVLAAILLALPARDRWILAGAFAGFTAVHCMVVTLAQRYYEPFILMFLVLAVSRMATERPQPRRWELLAPVSLGLLQMVITTWLVRTPP